MKIVLFFALIFAALAEPKKQKGIRTQLKEKIKENGFDMVFSFLVKLTLLDKV